MVLKSYYRRLTLTKGKGSGLPALTQMQIQQIYIMQASPRDCDYTYTHIHTGVPSTHKDVEDSW